MIKLAFGCQELAKLATCAVSQVRALAKQIVAGGHTFGGPDVLHNHSKVHIRQGTVGEYYKIYCKFQSSAR